MVKKEEKIILYDSSEAAQLKDLKLWVSAKGHVYNDEHLARWDGCTHKKCECGRGLVEKSWIACELCKSEKDHQRYLDLPLIEWDGKTPLCDDLSDTYFFDEGEIADYCEANEIKEEDLRLLICEPQYAYKLDAEDIYQDLLPEDGEVPDEIKSAFDELNKRIAAYKQPLSWIPGKGRVLLKDYWEKKIGEKAW